MSTPRSPTEMLQAFGTDRRPLGDALLAETYTTQGLLRNLWFGADEYMEAVVCCPGAMGGLIGPASGIWHDLGRAGAPSGRSLVIVDYRQPNDEQLCLVDALATADHALMSGAKHIIFVGHSFGGAVALQCGIATGPACRGVLGLSTQSAGCENAAALAPTPLMLLHGADDQILPAHASAAVRQLAGYGTLEIIPGASHALIECREHVLERSQEFFDSSFT